jgi:hypothetical protein
MASFSTLAAAEARAKVLMDDGKSATYGIIEAHAARNKAGTIGVRVLRVCSTTNYGTANPTVDGLNRGGAFDFLTDDSTT